MLLSFGILLLVGLSMASICEKIGLPRIIGMLISGMILGPFVLDLIDSSILDISIQLRQIALIIILIKAGLTINIQDLKNVGRPAILMAFLPATFEILGYLIFAPRILGLTHIEALLMGAVLAAVSPAIVVPRMISLIESKYGTKKSIPQLILAGASCDDVFVILLFSTFVTMALGEKIQAKTLLEIPASIILGIILGAAIGVLLSYIFECFYKADRYIRSSIKVIIILSVSFVLIGLESAFFLQYSGLLAVVTMACIYKLKSLQIVSRGLSLKFGKLWIAAEIVLFILVGAAVDTSYLINVGVPALLMIFVGLAIRSIGVLISVAGSKMNRKEYLFCVFAYLPKATVQAAIGAIPLSLGLSCGDMILSVAVLGIVVTAPIGAMAIDYSYERFLVKEEI